MRSSLGKTESIVLSSESRMIFNRAEEALKFARVFSRLLSFSSWAVTSLTFESTSSNFTKAESIAPPFSVTPFRFSPTIWKFFSVPVKRESRAVKL